MTFKKLAAGATGVLATLSIAACGGESEAAAPSFLTSTITATVTETSEHTTTVTETPDPESGPHPTQTASEPTRAAAEPAEEAEGSSVTFGSGTHRVGSDIQPGTYRNSGGDGCYWERLSGMSGDFDDIITNDFSEGQSYVTIDPSDVAFSSSFCGTWEMVE